MPELEISTTMEESSNFGRSFGDSFAVQLTGQIMVIAILVLFVVVVFVILLQLYARFFWLRTEETQTSSDTRRRRSSQSLVFASRHDPAASNSGRGLDLAVLSSLPTVEFGSEDFKDGMECAVCLSDIIDGEKARVLPKCNHGFHLDCIDMWFKSNSTCPICRNVVAPDCSNSIDSPLELDLEAQTENSSSVFPIELPDFPTNVLFWGNRREISTGVIGLQESSSSSSESDGSPGLDIPNDPSPASSSSSLPPSARCYADDELKSPVTTRLRSLKRLLSRETRVIPCTSTSTDIQHQHGFGCKTQQT